MSSFETCWCLNYKKVSLHVSFLLMLSFGAKPISCIWCSTETRPVCERNQLRSKKRLAVMRTRKITWSVKAESLEENAKPSITARLRPSIKNVVFSVVHVGPLTPGLRAPRRTASADDISFCPDCLFSIFFVFDLGLQILHLCSPCP